MLKNLVSVLDFGSSKLTLLVGTGDVNHSFRLLTSVDCDYEGFSRGEFVEPNNLNVTISSAIKRAEKELQSKIDSIFVGVPAEFCFVYDAVITKTFKKKTKLTTKVIDLMFLENKENNPYTTHTIINIAPLFYIINDENKTNEPVGLVANKLQARTSYVLVDNKFKLMVSGILESLGLKHYDFISSTLSESVYLIDEHKRNEGAIVVDCGYSTTSVALVLGSGLKDLKSFSLGGGHITSDISRVLDLTYEEAEDLKRQAILTLKPSGVDFYEIEGNKRFGVKAINEIILTRIDKIVSLIKKCIDSFDFELPKYIPISITGGGLNYIEGISDYLRKVFDRPVEIVVPKALLYKKPDLSSSISLLNMAINL